MNWKTAYLRGHGRRMALSGLAAGALAAAVVEGVDLLSHTATLSPLSALLAGALLGLPLGLVMAPADALAHGFYARALRAAPAGAVACAVVGAVGFALIAWIRHELLVFHGQDSPIAPYLLFWVLMPLVLALLGGAIAWASALRPGERPGWHRRIRRGLVLGLVAGIPVATALGVWGAWGWVPLVAMALWGAVMALGLFWMDKRNARRWLRVLTGPGEDRLFPLEGPRVRLGKAESNEVPLLHFEEVYPQHCQINRENDHYEIVDSEQGGMVLVNFRHVEAQQLKHGDLVKVGSALLQYGEGP